MRKKGVSLSVVYISESHGASLPSYISSFAVDRNQPVMIPKDSSIQEADVGGNELSAKDILKLQRAYFCDGTIKVRFSHMCNKKIVSKASFRVKI